MKSTIEVRIIFDDVKFGIDVRDARRALGLTQQEVAERIGYKDGVSISAVEVARCTDTVTVRRYMALCNMLGLNPMHYWTTDEPELTREDVEEWWGHV